MPDATSDSLHRRFLRLWDSDTPAAGTSSGPAPVKAKLSTVTGPSPGSDIDGSAPVDLLAAGLHRRALDKVKVRGGAVDQVMRTMLSPFDIPMPADGRVPSLVPHTSFDPWRGPGSTPLSHLTFAEGPRLFMTQALAAGAFGKFRLGVWEDHLGGSADFPLVALKELRLSTAASWLETFVARRTKTRATPPHMAEREIGQLAAAHSPMALHGVVAHGDKLYLSLPLLEMDLLDAHGHLEESGQLDDDAARERLSLRVMHDVAQALAPMHAAAVVHRDIKPENLFVDLEGRIRVGDVGLARQLTDAQPFFAEAVGTDKYMAPEVAASEPSALAADVWSTSVTAINLALGTEIFVGPVPGGHPETVAAYRAFHQALPRQADGTIALEAVLRQKPTSPWSRTFRALAEVSVPLATFMLNRGLHPDPQQRATLAEQRVFAANALRAAGVDPDAPEPLLHGAVEDTGPHKVWRALLLVYRDALQQVERVDAAKGEASAPGPRAVG